MLYRKAVLSIIMCFFFFHNLFSQDWYEDDENYFLFNQEGVLTIVGALETTQQLDIVRKEEIERRAAQDLATFLEETLSLNIVRYGAYGNETRIKLRGLDSQRIAFLIDGVPANSAMDGGFDIDSIDVNSIERIEVIHGGSDTRYNVSGAMGGIVNIITVRSQEPGLRLGFSLSNTSHLPGEHRGFDSLNYGPDWEDLFDAQNITLSVAYGGNGFSIRANGFANRVQNHFLFTDHYSFTRRQVNNEIWDAGGGASVVWNLSDLTKLIASTNFNYGDKNLPSTGFSIYFGEMQDTVSRSSLMLDMPRAFHDDFSMEAAFAYHFFRRDYTSSAGAFSRHDQNNIIAINRWGWHPGEHLTLRPGFDYRLVNLDSTDVGNRNRHDGGVYLTAEYKPLEQFMIIPSVKTVFATEGNVKFTAVPKLGLLWLINDSLTLRNNYFRYFKFPDFQDLYWAEGGGTAGNPDLRVEYGWGGDLGVTWNFRKLSSLYSTFHTHWLFDSIHWFETNGIWRPENVGESLFFGLDNRLKFDIPVSFGPVKKIIPSITYNYLLSYLLSFGFDFSDDKRIPYSPLHTLGVSLDFLWETGSFLVSGQYEGLRYADRPNLNELAPRFLLNATVNQKIGTHFTVFGVVRNLLNQPYESRVDYPMPGMSITIGVRTNLDVF